MAIAPALTIGDVSTIDRIASARGYAVRAAYDPITHAVLVRVLASTATLDDLITLRGAIREACHTVRRTAFSLYPRGVVIE